MNGRREAISMDRIVNGSEPALPHQDTRDLPALQDTLSLFDPAKPFLLHACCGPCLEWPARSFLEEKRSFVAWYYNPNIHPAVEHNRRRDTFFELAAQLGIDALAESAAEPEDWTGWKGSKADRCRMCYRRRLGAAAAKTAELGLAGFTTTLLISPWQNHEAIVETGEAVAREHGVIFLYRDLRPFYREGQRLAREDGLYRQKYCGCLPSIDDSSFNEKIRLDLEALEASSQSDPG
jgi:hypothetical protein